MWNYNNYNRQPLYNYNNQKFKPTKTKVVSNKTPVIPKITVDLSSNIQTINFNNLQNKMQQNVLKPTYIEPKIKSNRRISQVTQQPKNKLDIVEPSQKKIKCYNGTIGLLNIGNTCFLNAALQNLKNTFILTKNLLVDCSDINFPEFTNKFRHLLANLINQESQQYFAPNKFYSQLINMTNLFSYGNQNDSNFCIIYILSVLANELKNFKPFFKIDYSPIYFISKLDDDNLKKEKFQIFFQKYREKRQSPIIDNFYGFQLDVYKCENKRCNYINYTFQIISVLNLPIVDRKNKKINGLKNAIQYYQEQVFHINEKDFFCKKCNLFHISTQSILISLPKILIINLKRIGEKDFYSHNLEIPPTFESKDIAVNSNGANLEYELTGFIKHYGGAKCGHNIAICRNFFDSNWYEYDDSRVKSIYNSNNYINNEKFYVDLTNAFLFFYTQREKKQIENSINDNIKKMIVEKAQEIRLKNI